ncbi:hypothetical protein J6590_032106 [Homalodisca vitripennis]|nr:hypothetical protein J6590_032106 [Homalodisca vitripennis]
MLYLQNSSSQQLMAWIDKTHYYKLTLKCDTKKGDRSFYIKTLTFIEVKTSSSLCLAPHSFLLPLVSFIEPAMVSFKFFFRICDRRALKVSLSSPVVLQGLICACTADRIWRLKYHILSLDPSIKSPQNVALARETVGAELERMRRAIFDMRLDAFRQKLRWSNKRRTLPVHDVCLSARLIYTACRVKGEERKKKPENSSLVSVTKSDGFTDETFTLTKQTAKTISELSKPKIQQVMINPSVSRTYTEIHGLIRQSSPETCAGTGRVSSRVFLSPKQRVEDRDRVTKAIRKDYLNLIGQFTVILFVPNKFKQRKEGREDFILKILDKCLQN